MTRQPQPAWHQLHLGSWLAQEPNGTAPLQPGELQPDELQPGELRVSGLHKQCWSAAERLTCAVSEAMSQAAPGVLGAAALLGWTARDALLQWSVSHLELRGEQLELHLKALRSQMENWQSGGGQPASSELIELVLARRRAQHLSEQTDTLASLCALEAARRVEQTLGHFEARDCRCGAGVQVMEWNEGELSAAVSTLLGPLWGPADLRGAVIRNAGQLDLCLLALPLTDRHTGPTAYRSQDGLWRSQPMPNTGPRRHQDEILKPGTAVRCVICRQASLI